MPAAAENAIRGSRGVISKQVAQLGGYFIIATVLRQEPPQRQVRAAGMAGEELRVEVRKVAVLDHHHVPGQQVRMEEAENPRRRRLSVVGVIND